MFFRFCDERLGLDSMFLTHEMARTYVFDLALDAEDGLVGGSAEVDDPVVQPLVLPDMNELLPCL